ncbi:hypothetical protein AB0C84_06425 [Actinomadura sp. NPDC048955]
MAISETARRTRSEPHVFVDLNDWADPNGDFLTTEPVSLLR